MHAACCLWPVLASVFFGVSGADNDAEQLALTEQLFDAASSELGVVALDEPCFQKFGDFASGHRRDFMVGHPLVAAAVASTGGSFLILL